MITAEQLDALERRYTQPEDQKCVVCGALLQFSTSDVPRGFLGRYNCSSDDASPIRSTRPLLERLEHYDASTWWDRGQADPLVVLLVQAYRELEPRTADIPYDAPLEPFPPSDSTGAGDRWEDPRDAQNGGTA